MIGQKQIVQFVHISEKELFSDLVDTFAIREDRPHLWLQKVAIWVLRKLGAHARERGVSYERVVVDTGKFLDRLLQQREDVRRLLDRNPSTLLIGPEDYHELTGQLLSYHISFISQYHYRDSSGTYVCGLKVHVVPWMKGMVVLPKLEDL